VRAIDQERTMRKVFWRLLPILFVAYILAYVDRINIGFAALKMDAAIGIDSTIYGMGAGVFFLGYFLFEIPSTLLLEKAGARRWICRIMVSWGLLSACMALVQGPLSFIVVRFLLGVAEAGFFPGIILYLTYWFPTAYRARIIAAFMVAIPVSLAIGGPLSTTILLMDGVAGVRGWQWLFVIEGLPTVVFGLVFLLTMPDCPREAKWLSGEERGWLQATLDGERKAVAAAHGATLVKMLVDPRLLSLAFIYFATMTSNLGLAFFLPQLLKSYGLTDMQTGALTAVPYVIGSLGLIAFGYVSDKFQQRRWTLFAALVLAGAGLIGAGAMQGLALTLSMMAIAAIGIYGAKAPFWPLPSLFLSGSAAAGGIAFINSVGNLGGFVGPYVVGWLRTVTHSFEAGLYFLGGISVLASLLTLVVVNSRFAARVPLSNCD
jgi:MFS transporter, ACS family, tartrate transporter